MIAPAEFAESFAVRAPTATAAMHRLPPIGSTHPLNRQAVLSQRRVDTSGRETGYWECLLVFTPVEWLNVTS